MSAFSTCVYLFLAIHAHDEPDMTAESASQLCAGLDGDDRTEDFSAPPDSPREDATESGNTNAQDCDTF